MHDLDGFYRNGGQVAFVSLSFPSTHGPQILTRRSICVLGLTRVSWHLSPLVVLIGTKKKFSYCKIIVILWGEDFFFLNKSHFTICLLRNMHCDVSVVCIYIIWNVHRSLKHFLNRKL